MIGVEGSWGFTASTDTWVSDDATNSFRVTYIAWINSLALALNFWNASILDRSTGSLMSSGNVRVTFLFKICLIVVSLQRPVSTLQARARIVSASGIEERYLSSESKTLMPSFNRIVLQVCLVNSSSLGSMLCRLFCLWQISSVLPLVALLWYLLVYVGCWKF